jgi:hypothetical protein
MVLNGVEDETVEVGAVCSVNTNGGMGTMDIRSVGTIVAIDLVSTIVMTFLVRECYGSPKKQEF